MADLPADGNETRSAKRPASAVRAPATELDEAPAAKRSKVTVERTGAALNEEDSAVHVFWSRIFVALMPDALHLGRFVLPAKPSQPGPPSSSLFCVTVDMNTQPLVQTIKRKIQSEHGTQAPQLLKQVSPNDSDDFVALLLQ